MRAPAAAILAMAAIALLPACTTSNPGTAAPTSTTASSTPAPSKCSYQPKDPTADDKDAGLPTGSESTAGSVTLRTNQGEIKISLSGTAAPCTVRSFVHLVEKQYFDGTKCHRLTLANGLKVLQCGDPTATGRGGPGYTIPDENPTDLKPGPPGPDGSPTAIYPRGIVAMARTGAPHSGGSQFFLVHGNSTLKASYATFGTVDEAGLAVLDKIAAGGVVARAGPEDGTPKLDVTIKQAVVGP